jgi:hypothetical protein
VVGVAFAQDELTVVDCEVRGRAVDVEPEGREAQDLDAARAERARLPEDPGELLEQPPGVERFRVAGESGPLVDRRHRSAPFGNLRIGTLA